MSSTRYLTGITTTGTPHLGNYVGAIRPAIENSRKTDVESYFFLADYHGLIKCREPAKINQSTKEIAATWLALGLDTDTSVFYRQSDVPEISELCWILSCCTAKGLMNRAHAYKAAAQDNVLKKESDPDAGITMGLFSYPILMAADILMFNAHYVPVGKDQVQHVEMARDIAQRFNHHYGDIFNLPTAVVDESVAVLKGVDGRKMSKSYNNFIPLFGTEKALKKSINKIKTNLLEPGEPKDIQDSTLFELWQAFATEEETSYMKDQFSAGIAWGQAKKELFELINSKLKEPRDRYTEYMNDTGVVEEILVEGGAKARQQCKDLIRNVREAVGLYPLS